MPLRRRHLLAAPALLVVPAAPAQPRRANTDPLRVGVDQAIVDSGLARSLQVAVAHDTGISAKLVPGPAVALLQALERGELDVALTNAPDAELALDKQGLVHDRQAIAAGEFVIVGPATKGKQRDAAGLAGGHDVVEALTKLRDAAAAAPGSVVFLSAGDGSGTHTAEQALWRAAKIAPAAPWYRTADPKTGSLYAELKALGPTGYALVERGAWAARGGAPHAVLVDGDPRQRAEVHAMRSFRVNHPAGKIFVAWISGAKGRAVAAGVRGYRQPAA